MKRYWFTVNHKKQLRWNCSECRPKKISVKGKRYDRQETNQQPTRNTFDFFNYKGALRRIAPRSTTNRIATLLPRITQELLCLPKDKGNNLAHLSADAEFPKCQPSNFLLGKYCPGMCMYTALNVTGDGNCLFNTASLVLTGSEARAAELCLRTLFELVENKTYYITN